MRTSVLLSALLFWSAIPLRAQAPPAINILREMVKEGRSGIHEKVEAEWVAANRRAKHPGYYVALEALSGAPEVWFVQPLESFAQAGEFREKSMTEPLRSEIGALDARDGELRQSSRTMWAVLRPDLSFNANRLQAGKAKFWSFGNYRVQLGKNEDFASGFKMIVGSFKKANIDFVSLTYEVMAGAPAGTFLVFEPMESLSVMDTMMARWQAMAAAMGPERSSKFMRSAGDLFVSMDMGLFAVNPRMSYVSKAIADQAPEFWLPKPVKAAAAPAKKTP